MLFLVMRWSAGNIEGRKKTDRRKTLKSEEKEKRRIRGKSNNNNVHLLFQITFCSYTYLKKSCLYHQILFTVFMRCSIFETQ